jgi:hypothetical protein
MRLEAGRLEFPATANPSSNANTLDDYEEGDWTPTVEGTTTAGAGTYTARVGRYTKIGNLVTAQCALSWTAHTGTGNTLVSGLPFTSGNVADLLYMGSAYGNEMNYGTNATQLIALVTPGDSYISLRGAINNALRSDVPLDTAVGNLAITVVYRV